MDMGKGVRIKVCGLTSPREAAYLNENAVDYGGFVLFFEKSRRCVSLGKAKEIMNELVPGIRRVAVTVSPDPAQAAAIAEAGFDLLQVHGALSREVLEAVQLPVWYAVNIGSDEALKQLGLFLEDLPTRLSEKITGLLADGAEYGGGKTFDWNGGNAKLLRTALEGYGQRQREFILAGGLHKDNVAEGIRIFSPGVVDVSSGVEYSEDIPPGRGAKGRKSPERIRAFCCAARESCS